MRQKRKSNRWIKLGLNVVTTTFRVCQKRMTYDALFACFCLFHKRAFLRCLSFTF
jgi:hypothetical protein